MAEIRSDVLTRGDLYRAFADALSKDGQDIYPFDVSAFSPRRHKNGVRFYAYSEHGSHRSQHDREAKAASWEAWGYVIARLFVIDPDAHISGYKGVQEFVKLTSTAYGQTAGFLDLV